MKAIWPLSKFTKSSKYELDKSSFGRFALSIKSEFGGPGEMHLQSTLEALCNPKSAAPKLLYVF